MFERYRIIHFTGIGGIGMSGIAEVLYNLGYEVTGSDIRESDTVERLRGLGINVHIGHRPENVRNAHVVVVSSAVQDDNPEIVEAKRRAIPVIPRAEMLAELGRLKYGVLVAGSHGKTTTTSLISTLLAHAGFDPTVIIGGKLKALGTNARLGRGEFLVAEADESDGSFLKLTPTLGVVTNIDREHMDYFKTTDALKEAFLFFMNNVPFYGCSILCIEDTHVRELLSSVHRKVITYGYSSDAELRAFGAKAGFMSVAFSATLRGKDLGEFTVPLAGAHNVLNSLAAIAVGLELQIPLERIKEALKSFSGVQRRLEFKGEGKGVKVYDDYGHHPTEIKATLKAVRESFDTGRLIVVFQPHRYSRTRDLFDEFSTCFTDADMLYIMDIYAAGEKPIEGVTAKALAERIREKKKENVFHIGDREEIVRSVVSTGKAGDIVLTLGAGDVYKLGDLIIGKLGDAK